MPAEARARVRERVLAGVLSTPASHEAALDREFAALFARERALDAHRHELDRRERQLEQDRLACEAAERLLADRLQALALRCHLLDAVDAASRGPG